MPCCLLYLGPIPFSFTRHNLHFTLLMLFYFLKFLADFFSRKSAFLASLLFLVHPINSEAVVYISNLQDVLFCFFGLLAFWVFLNFRRDIKRLLLIFGLLLLSVLSKETGVLFLLSLLLYVFLFERKLIFKTIIGVGLVIIIYSGLRLHAVGFYKYENELFPMMQMPISQRLLHIPIIISYYVKTLLLPINLSFAQSWTIKDVSVSNFYGPLLSILIFLGIFFWAAVKQIKGKTFPLFLFFSLFVLLGILMHIQIVPLDMTVADRWFYFPFIGILGLLQIWFSKLKKTKHLITGFLSLTVVLFCLTFSRSLDWQNQYTLYGHDVKFNTQSYQLQNGWALELMNKGKYNEAEPFIRQSIKLKPDFCYSWNNLGSVYAQKKDFNKARQYYEQALKKNPCTIAYNNLATLMYYHFDHKDAYTYIKTALRDYPNSPRLYLMLALLENEKGNKEAALMAAKNSYKLNQSTASIYVINKIKDNQKVELSEY